MYCMLPPSSERDALPRAFRGAAAERYGTADFRRRRRGQLPIRPCTESAIDGGKREPKRHEGGGLENLLLGAACCAEPLYVVRGRGVRVACDLARPRRAGSLTRRRPVAVRVVHVSC